MAGNILSKKFYFLSKSYYSKIYINKITFTIYIFVNIAHKDKNRINS